MRSLASRPPLAPKVQAQLQQKMEEIVQIADPQTRKDRARTIYDSARPAQWFEPVITALRSLCGERALCMYCSSNEPSQVEHYRPLAHFPELALHYENYLWSCDICNKTKRDRFPPDTEQGERILNPMEDKVWDYFYLDPFGRLTPQLDPATEIDSPRAVSTCEIVGINREEVQKKRQRCYKRLCKDVNRAMEEFRAGTLTQEGLRDTIRELYTEPYQADVADYFLNGPGREKEPFRSALAAAGDLVLLSPVSPREGE